MNNLNIWALVSVPALAPCPALRPVPHLAEKVRPYLETTEQLNIYTQSRRWKPVKPFDLHFLIKVESTTNAYAVDSLFTTNTEYTHATRYIIVCE